MARSGLTTRKAIARKALYASPDKGALVQANLDSLKPRSGKVDALASRIGDTWKRANANATPPQGAVFTAKNPSLPVFMDTSGTDFDRDGSNLRPMVGFMPRVKRFKRFAKG